MTAMKIKGKLAGLAVQSLFDLTKPVYDHPGVRLIGVVELAHIERSEPAPGEDQEASVTMQIKAIEIAHGDQQDHLRRAMHSLYMHRTAQGTIDEALEPQLSESTIADLGNDLNGIEAARLRVALEEWSDYIARVLRTNLTKGAALDELRTVQMGLGAAIARTAT